MTQETVVPPYRIADITLADFGRREINLAEVEMPGLMALRQEYADQNPLAGARTVSYTHLMLPTNREV